MAAHVVNHLAIGTDKDGWIDDSDIANLIQFGVPEAFAKAIPGFIDYWQFFSSVWFEIQRDGREVDIEIMHQDDYVLLVHEWSEPDDPHIRRAIK